MPERYVTRPSWQQPRLEVIDTTRHVTLQVLCLAEPADAKLIASALNAMETGVDYTPVKEARKRAQKHIQKARQEIEDGALPIKGRFWL